MTRSASAVRTIVVEDQFIVAADIQATLTQMGHEVVGHCATVESCLQRTAELKPDLVLMDINLGGRMLGIEAAIQIRERHDIPVVFLTAYADDNTIESAKLARPAGYLIKPYRPAELRVAIEMATYKHRLQVAAELAQRQARLEERRFRALFEWAGVGIALLDADGKVVESNPTMGQMLGDEGLLGKALHALSVESFAVTERKLFGELVRGERGHYKMETRYPRANGDLGWGAVTATLLPSEEGIHAIRILSDISPRRLQQVAHFQENERRLLSTEIHDAVSQPLAAIFYRLQLVEQLHEREAVRAKGELSAACTMVKALLEDVSGLIGSLRAPPLDGSRAVDAVRELVESMRAETTTVVELTAPDRIPAMGKLTSFFLYRIVQEALTNVRRHAEASCVQVRLKVDGPWLDGVVEDDGRGEAVVPDPSRSHYGVQGMCDRADLIGGWLEVSYSSGTRVAFRLPLELHDAE